MTSFVMKKA